MGQHYEDDSVSATQTKRYYGGGTLLATRTGTTLSYVQGDHLGSTSTLTNGGGNVVGRERYSAFGERRRLDNAAITDQLYTGQRLNVLSGLYHYSDGSSAGRFYDPLLARFVQADPYASNATHLSGLPSHEWLTASPDPERPEHDHDSASDDQRAGTPSHTAHPRTPRSDLELNSYAYVRNNPLRHIDPTGYWTISLSFGGMGFFMLTGRADAVQVAIDGEGNVGLLLGGGGGFSSGFGFTVGPTVQLTSLPTVDDLKGPSVQFGATGLEIIGGTAEVVFFDKGWGLQGFPGRPTIAGTPTIPPVPVVVHGTATYSWEWWKINLWDYVPKPAFPQLPFRGE